MGSSFPHLYKTKQIDISNLYFVKKSSIGTFYTQKQTHNQLLSTQTLAGPNIDTQQSKVLINKHIKQRMQITHKNIPTIQSIKYINNTFCSTAGVIQLWMVHPSRSLKQQIIQRQNTNQLFGQGEIWMIIYSALNACIVYEQLSYNILLTTQNIFISQSGDVIVSDAHIYRKPNFYIKSHKYNQIQYNIQKLRQIIKYIMAVGHKYNYLFSTQLYSFIQGLCCKQNGFVSYSKLLNQVIEYRRKLEKQMRQQKQSIIKSQLIQQVQSQIVYTSRFPFQELSNLNIKQLIQDNKEPNLNKNKKKWYRTTPILRPVILSAEKTHILTVSDVHNGQKNWSQTSNLSSISSVTTQNQANNNGYKDYTLNAVNRLFGQQQIKQPQYSYVCSQAQNLWKKNKKLLQNLALKQKNMIVEVTESQIDLQSMRSPSKRNLQLLSPVLLNSISHQESQGL